MVEPGAHTDSDWAPHDPSGAGRTRAAAAASPEKGPEPTAWVRRGALETGADRSTRTTEPADAAWDEPPPGPPSPADDDDPYLARKGPAADPVVPVVRAPVPDPGRRAALADTFVGEFVGSATWSATLAVLEGAFPGSGMAMTLSRRADELWGAMVGLDRRAAAALGVPAWLDHAGMVFDLSAHTVRARRAVAYGRASRPYPGAFVIDTLDPLRYHRPVGGPVAPGTGTPAAPRADSEDEDGGVVIVGNLAASGVRVLDSAELWRYVGQVVTGTLHEPGRAETRARARGALRVLRRAVVVDPDLRLALCLGVDEARVPRCLLALTVRDETPRFVRA